MIYCQSYTTWDYIKQCIDREESVGLNMKNEGQAQLTVKL